MLRSQAVKTASLQMTGRGLCGLESPNGEWECPHYCELPAGHDGDHSVTFNWADADYEPEPAAKRPWAWIA